MRSKTCSVSSLFLLLSLLMYMNVNLKAQCKDTIPRDNEIYYVVDLMPEYPGGEQELQKYIATNFKTPEFNKLGRIEGKFYVRFAIMPDGRVDSIRMLRTVDPLLDAEGIRLVKSLPRWKPGRLNGVPVAVWYRLFL